MHIPLKDPQPDLHSHAQDRKENHVDQSPAEQTARNILKDNSATALLIASALATEIHTIVTGLAEGITIPEGEGLRFHGSRYMVSLVPL
ncbi:hypothetical protein ACI3PL_20235, partial [Lacticaseibacillus paracasei]